MLIASLISRVIGGSRTFARCPQRISSSVASIGRSRKMFQSKLRHQKWYTYACSDADSMHYHHSHNWSPIVWASTENKQWIRLADHNPLRRSIPSYLGGFRTYASPSHDLSPQFDPALQRFRWFPLLNLWIWQEDQHITDIHWVVSLSSAIHLHGYMSFLAWSKFQNLKFWWDHLR